MLSYAFDFTHPLRWLHHKQGTAEMLAVGGGRRVKHSKLSVVLKIAGFFPALIDSPVTDHKFLRLVMGCGEIAFLLQTDHGFVSRVTLGHPPSMQRWWGGR